MIQFFGDGFKDRQDLFYHKLYAYLLNAPNVKFPAKRKETFIQPQRRKELEKIYTESPIRNDDISLQKSARVEESILVDPYGLGFDSGTGKMYEELPTNEKRHPERTPSHRPSPRKSPSNSGSKTHDEGFIGKEKVVKDQIDNAHSICDIFIEVLRQLVRDGQSIKSNDVLSDLLPQLKEFHKLFLKYLEKTAVITNERLLDHLLRINDRIVDSLKDYDKAIHGKLIIPKEVVIVKEKEEKKKKKKKSSSGESKKSSSPSTKDNGPKKIEPIEMRNLTRLFSRQTLESQPVQSSSKQRVQLDTVPTFNPEESHKGPSSVEKKKKKKSKEHSKAKSHGHTPSRTSSKSKVSSPSNIDLLTSFDLASPTTTSSTTTYLQPLQPQNPQTYPMNSQPMYNQGYQYNQQQQQQQQFVPQHNSQSFVPPQQHQNSVQPQPFAPTQQHKQTQQMTIQTQYVEPQSKQTIQNIPQGQTQSFPPPNQVHTFPQHGQPSQQQQQQQHYTYGFNQQSNPQQMGFQQPQPTQHPSHQSQPNQQSQHSQTPQQIIYSSPSSLPSSPNGHDNDVKQQDTSFSPFFSSNSQQQFFDNKSSSMFDDPFQGPDPFFSDNVQFASPTSNSIPPERKTPNPFDSPPKANNTNNNNPFL